MKIFAWVRLGSLSFALFPLAALAQGTASPPAGLLPLTDNTAAPYLGVYEACVGPGIALNGKYAAWLNRTLVWGHDTIPFGSGSTWEHIAGKWDEWFYVPWSTWVHAAPGRRLVLSMPMLPGPTDGSGPARGEGAHLPVSLAQGAIGAYNEHFRGLAQTLVKYGLGDTIIRLGWEWNGNWYAWKVVTLDDAHNFAAYWRQIVDTMRSVPGAQNLKFDWNPSNAFRNSYDPMEAYPGDTYVDYVGVDAYDETWAQTPEFPKGIYPTPPGMPDEEAEARHEAAWSHAISSASDFGVAYWQKIADDHGKPMTFPEWGLIQRPPPNDRGGFDDPYYIQKMYEYIQDPAHHVYFASYFDCDAGGEGNSRISPVNGKPSQFPKAQALYQQLFRLPGGTKTAAAAPTP
jgi:hypothetical protein